MSPFVPEYGTSDYARWRAQVTPDSLRWFIDVTDSSVMQTLRSTLSAGSGGAEFCKSSSEQLLHLLARRINGGELAIFGQPTRSSHPSQWLCSDSHVPFYARHGHTARQAPAATGVWAKPELEEVAAAVAAITPRKGTRNVVIDLVDEHRGNFKSHQAVKDGTRYKLTTDQEMVREGVVTKGRIEEKDLTLTNDYWLEFIAPV